MQVIDKTLPSTIGEADADIKCFGPLCGYSVSGRQEDAGLRCEPARRQRVCHRAENRLFVVTRGLTDNGEGGIQMKFSDLLKHRDGNDLKGPFLKMPIQDRV